MAIRALLLNDVMNIIRLLFYLTSLAMFFDRHSGKPLGSRHNDRTSTPKVPDRPPTHKLAPLLRDLHATAGFFRARYLSCTRPRSAADARNDAYTLSAPQYPNPKRAGDAPTSRYGVLAATVFSSIVDLVEILICGVGGPYVSLIYCLKCSVRLM